MIRVADYVVERLVAENIRHIFLVTGRGILYLSDAVAKNEDMQSISVHHEQAGAYAAIAYSQYNDHLGACLVSTGCASTNALTGVLNAWQDGVPVIFISGQNKLHETVGYTGKKVRTYGSQEANIIPIVSPITKYSTMVMNPNEIGEVMDKAIYYAQEGFKGPVWIDIPVDVQNMRVKPEELTRWTSNSEIPIATQEEISYVVDALSAAERPVILFGNGIRSAGAVEEAVKLVEMLNIPVVFSSSAVDIYGTANTLSVGAVGTLGATRAGNFAVQNADLVLSIGCRLSPLLTGSEYTKFARAAKVIAVDINKDEQSKDTIQLNKVIISDAKAFMTDLLNTSLKKIPQTWVDKCLYWKLLFPKCEDRFKQSEVVDIYHLAELLSKYMHNDEVILSDAGLEELIIPSTIDFKKGQRCLHPASQGCMGVALPAAMGAYYSCGHSVIAVIGDGSVMMNLQELQTISYYKMAVKLIIVNNGIYSVIRKRQKELFRTRTIGTDVENGVSTPDFEKVASCFNIPYIRIANTRELESGIEKLLQADGPIFCEIIAVEDQDYIRNAAAFNSQRKFVNRPIEDQYPFQDRELIKKEMIVEPIDL